MILRQRYDELDVRYSEGLWFTGTELARLIGRQLNIGDVDGVLDGAAQVVQMLADELASPRAATPRLRLFVDWEPYLYRGRFRQDQVLFACVDAALVGSWRRPVGELRQLIDTIGKVLEYPFNDEAVGATRDPQPIVKPLGRPRALNPSDLANLIGQDGSLSNAALGRKLHVSRQTVMRARKQLQLDAALATMTGRS